MNSGTQKAKGMISIEDFDPLGHKDKMINTPRSLMACQELGIKPEELFLWNEEGFLKALGQEGIDNIDTGAAYQQYLEEMQLIFEKIRELREQIIEENDNGETGNFQGNNINVDMAQVEPEVDNTDDDDGEEHDQHHIKSKNLSKSRKLKKRTKKRPKTATNYGSQPSADMMNQFQKAQFLQSNKTKNRRSRLDDEDEDSPEPLPFNERSQKPSNSSKIHELELKEQRRQVNMLQSTTHADRKRERLMRKLLEGNLQARKAVLIKKDYKKQKQQELMYKSADRDRVVSHKKLTEMYKAHSIAMKRDQKDEWAKIQIQHLRDMKLKKAMEKKMRWEEKMAQVHNVKDLAEFKRGLMLADITLQDDRYQMWRKSKEEEQLEKLQLQKAIQKRRQDLIGYFKQVKKARECEIQEINTKIQTEKGLEEVVQHLNGVKKPKSKITKKNSKKAKSRPAKRAATEYNIQDDDDEEDMDKQIKSFKSANRKQIKQIQKEKTEAINALLAEAEANGESITEELQHNIANIELMTEEKVQQIKNYEKKTIQQFLLSR